MLLCTFTGMKLLLSISLLLMLYSCQSEYQEQFAKAKKLVVSEQKIKGLLRADFSESSMESLKGIQEEIRFQAHLSGNESYFMMELGKYRQSLREYEVQRPMISRFP